MEYKSTVFGVTVDHDLTIEEIVDVHAFWRTHREEEYFLHMTWNQYKDLIGLSHESKRTPRWIIKDKEKWVWAKLKYGF